MPSKPKLPVPPAPIQQEVYDDLDEVMPNPEPQEVKLFEGLKIASSYLLLLTYFFLLTSSYLLLITYFFLLTSDYLLLITYF